MNILRITFQIIRLFPFFQITAGKAGNAFSGFSYLLLNHLDFRRYLWYNKSIKHEEDKNT